MLFKSTSATIRSTQGAGGDGVGGAVGPVGRDEYRRAARDCAVLRIAKSACEWQLQNDVLLIVMGEMSHTPRLSNFNGQPGREHWGQTMSLLMSGGGLRTGQVIGATSAKGDEPAERPLSPNDFLATWYRAMGVPLASAFRDLAGRPSPILPSGKPIEELF